MKPRREMSLDVRARLRELHERRAANRQCDDEADAEAERWNAAHSVGTAVDVTRDDGSSLHTRTRSVAWRTGAHAVVLVEGITGGYLLGRVAVVQEGLIASEAKRKGGWFVTARAKSPDVPRRGLG